MKYHEPVWVNFDAIPYGSTVSIRPADGAPIIGEVVGKRFGLDATTLIIRCSNEHPTDTPKLKKGIL